MVTTISREEIFSLLSQINDPEVPAINIVELGVVREVNWENELLVVSVTPTYSGCPAMKMIEEEIQNKLHANGFENFKIKTVFFPAWTTDWMSDSTKQKLKEYGIAPPLKTSKLTNSPFHSFELKADCPFCGSNHTTLKSAFGSTACKALFYCDNCQQPFEHFKCI